MFAPQPFNYNLQGPTPVQRAMEGYAQGQQINTMRSQQRAFDLKSQAIQQAQAQAQKMQADLAAFSQKPNKTAKDYADFSLQYPQIAEDIRKSYDMVDKDAQKTLRGSVAGAYSAIENGQTDIAKEIVEEVRQDALSLGDEMTAKTAELTLKSMDVNPEAVKSSLGIWLASTSDNFAEDFKTLTSIEKDKALTPGELKKQGLEIEQMGKDLGLTTAQIAKTAAETKNLNMDMRKTALELEALTKGGTAPLDPEKRFNVEQKARKEYNAEIQPFIDTQEAYRRLVAAEDTAAGDISLVIAYNKMLDPGSVVREGEFKTAESARGLPADIRSFGIKIASGERLTAAQRKSFRSQAEKLLAASKKRQSEVEATMSRVVDRYGLDRESIFTRTEEVKPQESNNIPQGAISMLQSNPALAAQFDAKYGAGASESILNGR